MTLWHWASVWERGDIFSKGWAAYPSSFSCSSCGNCAPTIEAQRNLLVRSLLCDLWAQEHLFSFIPRYVWDEQIPPRRVQTVCLLQLSLQLSVSSFFPSFFSLASLLIYLFIHLFSIWLICIIFVYFYFVWFLLLLLFALLFSSLSFHLLLLQFCLPVIMWVK